VLFEYLHVRVDFPASATGIDIEVVFVVICFMENPLFEVVEKLRHTKRQA
jgi:hypothetical protein